MANDGGVYWCDDGGRSEQSWQMPTGLETLDPVNIAGLFGIGDAPALYFGSGDNNDFFTRDGGAHWEDPGSGCGDCDAGSKTFVPSPKKISFANPTRLSPYAASDVYLIGYRPLIRTLATEAPLPDGDVVIIEQALDGTAILLRTTAISSIKRVDDWH